MKNLRSFLLSLGGLLLVSQFAIVSPVSAQSSKKLERERLNRIMDSSANVEEFRQEYDNYLAEIEDALQFFDAVPALHKKLAQSGLRSVEQLSLARQNLAKMKPDDLEKMREVYAKVPGWRNGSRAINSLIKPELRQRIGIEPALEQSGGESTNVITPDVCPDPKDVPSNTDISIAKASEIAADLVMELLPTDALTIIIREIATIARAGLKGGVLAAETLKAISGDCNGAEFEAAIQQQVTNSTSTITGAVSTSTNTINGAISASTNTITGAVTSATNTIVNNNNANKTAIINNDNSNKDTIVNNDNANKTTIVNNDNANALALTNLVNSALTQIISNANANKDEVKNLLLRTQIEADLSSTDGSTFVALYETPSSVCFSSLNSAGLPQTGIPSGTVQCGLLDLVRSIVSQTITNVGGSSAAQAQRELAEGDAQRAAGQYKAAYTSYRKAYKTASK